jgi:ribonucleoside-diphosphate reductase alpha chain
MGGSRRSAIWAGLNWSHPDCLEEFITLKDWDSTMVALKEANPEFPMPMELTNISVIYDSEFFIAYADKKHPKHKLARDTWLANCKQAFRTAEPGMAFNFCKDADSLRNACTEVTSEDDSDKCNLGTVWLNQCADREEFAEACKYGTMFLLCGGLYSDTPTDKISEVGLANNRIGLGLGGISEWLMKRGSGYNVTPELHKWLNIYERESDEAAYVGAKLLGVAIPKGKRAIAPTGTIGILAETTTGIEPLFSKAYKRRYHEGDEKKYQYVVDGAVKRLQAGGVPPECIFDAYDISFKDRVKFQADVQQYVDMAISSTCNMPHWGSEENNESTVAANARTLMRYAKRLRGFTCYPDGSRGGQPLTRVPLDEALAQEGKVFEDTEQQCFNGVCGV